MEELIKELNTIALNEKDDTLINEADLNIADNYLANLEINTPYDVLMYLSSLNLFNAYAKQDKDHDIYKFKKYIATIINILNEKDIANVHIYIEKDHGSRLYIFSIFNYQFSFHDEKEIPISKKYYKELTFDGIRKQPCAKKIFYKCHENSLNKFIQFRTYC